MRQPVTQRLPSAFSASRSAWKAKPVAGLVPPIDRHRSIAIVRRPARAPVAELVDALDSKSSSARSAGSIPARGTIPFPAHRRRPAGSAAFCGSTGFIEARAGCVRHRSRRPERDREADLRQKSDRSQNLRRGLLLAVVCLARGFVLFRHELWLRKTRLSFLSALGSLALRFGQACGLREPMRLFHGTLLQGAAVASS